MDYNGIVHCFILDPENNGHDKVFLENLKLYEGQLKENFQNIEFDESYEIYEGNVLQFQK